ncbi:MAG: lipoprotein [Candidatus Izemoplasmataceae bacterium]
MKKLFSIAFALFFIATLAACGSEEVSESEMESLQDRVDSLEDRLSDQQEKTSDMDKLLSDIETTINEENMVFTVDTGEETIARTAPYSEESDLNAFELFEMVYDVGYDESDQGIFIHRIESLNTLEGNYIAISKNGSMIDTGLEEASFEGGDHFHFEIAWYDETLESVNEGIELFIDEQADTFVEDGDFYTVLGLHHLGHDDLLDDLEAPELSEDPSAGELIQSIFVHEVMEEDASDLRADLADEATTDYPYSAAQSYLALATGDPDDHDAYVEDFKTMLDDLDVSETDNDSLSLVLLALETMDDSDYDTLADDIVTHLEANAYENTYGDNAAGFAAVLTALVGAEEDPTSDAFEEEGENLVQHLLSYQADDGAFFYQLDDEETDMDFSTPQAFLALAAYQASLNEEDFTHPYKVD